MCDQVFSMSSHLPDEKAALRAEVARLTEELERQNSDHEAAIGQLQNDLDAANVNIAKLREAVMDALPYVEQSVEQIHESLRGYKPHIHEQADKDLANIKAAISDIE